ncbi:MAG: hypothetical protein R3284_12875, partial [Rubricoccaceae bacterium]|nr:hypothetical protein [Rubricoccaceae bacterium]
SAEARQRVFSFSIQAPDLEKCLLELRNAQFSVRRGLMLNLIDVVLADNSIEPGGHEGLSLARQILGITRDETEMLHEAAYAIQNQANPPGLKRPFRVLD